MRTELGMVLSGSASRCLRRCFLVLSILAMALFALLYEELGKNSLFSLGLSDTQCCSVSSNVNNSLGTNRQVFFSSRLRFSSLFLFGNVALPPSGAPLRSDDTSDFNPFVSSIFQRKLERKTFWEKQLRSFEKTFIVDGRWRLFADGLAVTLGITVASTVLGTFFAFIQCCMRRSTRRWLRYPAKFYIAIMQGTPILVILLIMYYVVFAKFQAPWGLEKEIVATISLALNFAAYAGEMMRTGVDSIDKGLVEAARALGFGRFQVFSKVIFPIATRRIIPVYKGEFISLLKTTSIVGYIATQDLTKASDIVRARTYEAFFPLVATAIIYLLSAHLLASVFAYMEYRLNPINRRKRAKGEVNV